MANTAFGSSIRATSLRDTVLARVDRVREGWGRWRLYRRTFDELSSLSTRDLDDLGISRSSIRAIALEAAYGK